MIRRTLVYLALLALAIPLAQADQGISRLQAFPSIAVADGHTQIVVSAEVRDNEGRLVANGTQVQFETNLGIFRETLVRTVNGVARATLVAGGAAGVADIKVTPLSGDGTPRVLKYEFVASRAELDSSREYIEIVAPGSLQYAADTKTIQASGINHGVSLRFRGMQIEADDLQLDILAYTVKARHARLRFGKLDRTFNELNLQLDQRTGTGTTDIVTYRPDALTFDGFSMDYLDRKADGTYGPAQPVERFSTVSIMRDSVRPTLAPADPNLYAFLDLSTAPSTVVAKAAVVFPRKEIQFQRAEIYVANARVVKLPLFQVNLFNISGSPLVTDDILNVYDNQIALNYPQYLALRPGFTSLLRFHTGDRYGRGFGSDRGAFLDYEVAWNRGDDFDGGLTIGGLGRDDWSVGMHQYWRIDDRSSASAQFDLPANRSIFGNGSLSRQFNGFQGSLSASHSQTLRGFSSRSQDYSFDLEKDPAKLGTLPLRLTYGLTGSQNFTQDQVLGSRQQQGAGFVTRLQSDSIKLDSRSNLVSSFTARRLFGKNEFKGIALYGSSTLSRRLNSQMSVHLTYDYTQDGFNEATLGRHRLALMSSYDGGRTHLSLSGSKSLTKDNVSVFGDASYRLGGLWNLSYLYTMERYVGNQYLDYNIVLGYKMGWRQIGLTYSKRTHRVGVQLFGATF